VLPREPDEEEAGDRSPHSKPTRDHPPATPGACHWLAHRSNRIRTQLPQVAIARRRAATFRSLLTRCGRASRPVTIVYGTTVIETKVTNDTEGHEAVSGLALSVDVAATPS
jgi:hypothetical protein